MTIIVKEPRKPPLTPLSFIFHLHEALVLGVLSLTQDQPLWYYVYSTKTPYRYAPGMRRLILKIDSIIPLPETV
jgi:hypothetical protein